MGSILLTFKHARNKMSHKVLHLIGSPTDEFSFNISLMYARSLASAQYETAVDHKNRYAVVHPGGYWSFPEDILLETSLSCQRFRVTEALARVSDMNLDLMVQHILCAKRPLYNAMFEMLDIPFIGSSSQVSSNIIDKAATRALLLQAGVPVPQGVVVGRSDKVVHYDGGFPAVVKPCKMENSMGVKIVHNEEEMNKALEKAFTYGDTAVVDAFIPGREVRCGVIAKNDGKLHALSCMEYKVATHSIRAYADKLEGDVDNLKQAASTVTWFVDEAEEEELVKRVQEVATAAYNVLGCTDFGQIDCRVSLTGQVYVLEANSFCSFGPLSLVTKLAEKQGIKSGELYAMMVNNVVNRSRKTRQVNISRGA